MYVFEKDITSEREYKIVRPLSLFYFCLLPDNWPFRILHDLTRNGTAQFIIATHSPILLGYPNSVILNFDDRKINEIEYEMTDHYQITKYFLQHREKVISEILD